MSTNGVKQVYIAFYGLVMNINEHY